MKLKSVLVVGLTLGFLVGGASAGPSLSISIGPRLCPPRPVFCPPLRPIQPIFFPGFCNRRQIWINPWPSYYSYGAFQSANRFSNVSGFVPDDQAIIRVPPPIFPVEPVIVPQGPAFRWR